MTTPAQMDPSPSGGDTAAIRRVVDDLSKAAEVAAEHVQLLREERQLLTAALDRSEDDTVAAGLRDDLRGQEPLLRQAEADARAASGAEASARRALRWEEQAVARQQQQRPRQPQRLRQDRRQRESADRLTAAAGKLSSPTAAAGGTLVQRNSAGLAQSRTASPKAAAAWKDGAEAQAAKLCQEERDAVETERARIRTRNTDLLKLAKALAAERQRQEQVGLRGVVSVQESLSPGQRDSVEDLILKENLRVIESKASKLKQAQAIHEDMMASERAQLQTESSTLARAWADFELQRQTEIEQLQGAFQRKGLSWPSVPAIASSPWLGPEAPPAAPSGDTSSGEE